MSSSVTYKIVVTDDRADVYRKGRRIMRMRDVSVGWERPTTKYRQPYFVGEEKEIFTGKIELKFRGTEVPRGSRRR